MLIREMAISDYENVYQLWTGTKGMGMRSLDDSKAGVEKFLKRNPATNFVAINDDNIIGVILCGHDGRRGYIYHTAVHSDYRGEGIGKELVDRVFVALRREGINKVALVAFKENDIGNSFWKSVGFEHRLDLNYWNKSININNI